MQHRLPPHQTTHARDLRTHLTDAERLLWSRLRSRQLHGHKFRRQHAIDRYIADFACLEHRLVVELDGGQHAGSAHDAERDACLRNLGWRVLRFWNHDVLNHVEGVLEVISMALHSPPFQPSPWQGEGAERALTQDNSAPPSSGQRHGASPSPWQGEGRGGGRAPRK